MYVTHWEKSTKEDIDRYKVMLDKKLKCLDNYDSCFNCSNYNCVDSSHLDMIDNLTSDIVPCCLDAASEALPNSTSTHKKGKRIPGWSDYVKPFKSDAIFWQAIYFLWVALNGGCRQYQKENSCSVPKSHKKLCPKA